MQRVRAQHRRAIATTIALVACLAANDARAQDDADAGPAPEPVDASPPPSSTQEPPKATPPPPDKLDDLPPIVDEYGNPIPPPPPNVPRMRAPVRPVDASSQPPDPLIDIIPVPPTDNRTGGDKMGAWQSKRNIYTSTGDLVLTGAAASVALTAAIVPPQGNHIYGGVLYDDAARDALRIRNLDTRYMIRDASDVGASFAATWPFLVDALLTAWWYRGDVKLARNMALVAAETMSITAAAQGVTNTIASRERPYGQLCGNELPSNSVDCEGSVRFRSFFSGHSAITFAAAGVMCWHHLGLGLIGGPWDVVTCASAYTVAASTAVFRVMADMHWSTDITVGAIVGTTVGLVVPWMHLSPTIDERERVKPITVRLSPVGQGLGVTGTW